MKKVKIEFSLPVSFLKEHKSFVAYTPALDLSTSGDTFEEAQKNFAEAVRIFFEELMEMGTMDEVLSGLGWQKQNNTFIPPVVIATQTENFSIPLAN
ncbi:MAG: hypothetical protein Q8Q49_05040 [bacterium]|nr:hypothetical protein [bacterium]